MGEVITQRIQIDLKTAATTWQALRKEALDLYNLYWKTNVNTDISGLASSTTACSLSSKLTKADALNAASLVEDIGLKFFDNQAVATSDRMIICQNLTHGAASSPVLLNDRVEDFCNRAKQLAQDCLTQYNRSVMGVNLYNASEVSNAVGAISAHTIVFGSEMTKDDLTSMITLMEQWKNMLTNAAVSTADYKATLGKWERL